MAYTRRQELICTEEQMNAKPNVVLRDGEVIRVRKSNGCVSEKMGDGVTRIIDLPYLNEAERAEAAAERAEEAATKAMPFVTPQIFGAVGDGSTDDSEKMAVAAAQKLSVDLGERSYVVSDTITLHTIFKNGTIIYRGDVNKPVVSLKDGGGLVDVKIIIEVENYASSVVLADYTTYSTQRNPMSWTIDGLHIDNALATDFVEGSSCIKITYNNWKVIGGQNISNVTFRGYMDYGINIEPRLENTGSGDAKVDTNPVFNTAVFRDIMFESCNTALKVYPKMLSGEAETALGHVKLMLLRFSNQHIKNITKPFFDLHNTTITGDMIIPWDYYGEHIPANGTYRLHNSQVNVNSGNFVRGNENDNVHHGWFYDEATGECYTNHNVIMPKDVGDSATLRKGGMPWSVDSIRAVRFKPEGDTNEYIGFEMSFNNGIDPTGMRMVQFGVSSSWSFVWRKYEPNEGKWGALHSIYADGSYPTSYYGNRADGMREGDTRFDVQYGKPIWWNGEKWIYASGANLGDSECHVVELPVDSVNNDTPPNEFPMSVISVCSILGADNGFPVQPNTNGGILMTFAIGGPSRDFTAGIIRQEYYPAESTVPLTRHASSATTWSDWGYGDTVMLTADSRTIDDAVSEFPRGVKSMVHLTKDGATKRPDGEGFLVTDRSEVARTHVQTQTYYPCEKSGTNWAAYIRWWDGSAWTPWNSLVDLAGSSNYRGWSTTPKYTGMCVFDTTLGKPVWYDGSKWVDATGATV